jgi:hypothetical protein
MSTSLLDPRLALRRGASLLLAAVMLALLVPTVQAVPKYSLTSAHYMTWYASGTRQISVRHMSTDSILLSFSKLGSSKFTLASNYIGWSAGDTSVKSVNVTFSTSIYDTSYGYVLLYDGYTRDTIQMVGVDTNYITPPSYDFTLSTHLLNIGGFSADSATYTPSVYNAQSSSIQVLAYSNGNQYWTINHSGRDSATFTISGHGGASIPITYHKHGVQRDSTLIYFYCFSPNTQLDSMWVYYRDSSSTTSDYSLSSHALHLLCTGDSASSTVTVRNLQTSTIYVVGTLRDSAYWEVNHSGSVLLGLSGSSSQTLTFTYHRHNGVTYDTNMIRFYCGTPYLQYDSIMLYAHDSTVTPSASITVSAPSLGTHYAGDTVCGTVTIYNSGSVGTNITSINFSGDWTWSSSGRPSLPDSLPSGSSATFSLCHFGRFIGNYVDSIAVGYGSSQFAHAAATVTVANGLSPSSDSIRLDDVLLGGYDDIVIPVVDWGMDTVQVQHYYSGTRADTLLSPSFPLIMHSGDTTRLHVRFQPTSAISYSEVYVLRGSSNSYSYIQLFGKAVASSADTLSLYRSQSDLLALTTDTTVTSHTFYFRNPLLTTIYVSNVGLTDGSHFSITGVSPHSTPPDDTLAGGALLGITVQFNGDTSGFYHDSLIVTTRDGARSWVFNLEALASIKPQGQQSVAPTEKTVAQLTLSPNPANVAVMIGVENAQRATVEIFDMLGNRVANLSNATSYQWAAEDLSSGIYIVRATGLDANGVSFTASKRLILER